MSAVDSAMDEDTFDIAVIGMAGRFPAAGDIGEFWAMLRDGVEGITFFSEQELLDEGIPAHVVADSHYVRAKGMVADSDLFDAAFFGYSPREAAFIDPQQRLFLECCWHALENAGIDPTTTAAAVGVYGGSSFGTYLSRPSGDLAYRPEAYEIVLGNDKDQLTTRVSYKLGLRGPSVCVQTACSTSLVAVHLACQALFGGDCTVALAGGVSVTFPRRSGHPNQKEGIYSSDGHCRPFDAEASGTVHGDGVGVVALKPLAAARADGDHIRAVIRGTAVNNDGSAKIGYSAPSIRGQAEAIQAAHRVADIDPATIGYVEAHGTGTALGDPAELAGLTRAFRVATGRSGYCGIGSVKSNIGHLDAAAGIAGFIKTVLALEHGLLPPNLHYRTPNPAMALEDSPFYVVAEPTPWPAGGTPRRAGVSSFGIGGTNAHVVVEEAPPAPQRPEASAGPELVVLSAKTDAALRARATDLADHLEDVPGIDLADVAETTRTGRTAFERRAFVVCADTGSAVAGLRDIAASGGRVAGRGPAVAFMFPGQGAQHAEMATGLYQTEPIFRAELDRCAEILGRTSDLDLRAVLLDRNARISETKLAQPALFAVAYALARVWENLGVQPGAFIGHSLGEYVAACLAGVLTLDDALTLVARRGQLMQQAVRGAMLSVQLPEHELGVLPGDVELAAVNAPDLCVVSGPEEQVLAFAARLEVRGVACRKLHTSHAFHSATMAGAAKGLEKFAAGLGLRTPTVPFVSNVTGTWITGEQATDPAYWARHTLHPVRFADGLGTLLRDEPYLLLEVGPGRTLTGLARLCAGRDAAVVASMRHPVALESDAAALVGAVGELWSHGVPIDWRRFRAGGQARRVPLPGYPFQRRRYWFTLEPEPRFELDEPDAEPGRAAKALESETQRRVAEVWQDLLGLDEVGPGDDFFGLGGHSLLGLRLAARLSEIFGIEVALRDLFTAPSVAAMAELVEALRWAGGGASETPMEFIERGSV